MAKTYRDYNPKAFLRKLGPEQALRYFVDKKHPLCPEVLPLLTAGDVDENLVERLLPLIESSENPHREEDVTAFAMINDMAGDKGFAQMVRICEQANLSYLITSDTTSHGLAFELYHNHQFFFNVAYTTLYLDLVEGWQIYPGIAPSALKEERQEALRGFQSDVVDALRRSGFGQDFHVDEYPDEERLILDIRYSGPLIRQEGFEEGKILAKAVRKPLEIGLVYYLKSGVLKVKTPRGQDTLNKSVHQAFALQYLENPHALLETKTERVLNLDELKTRQQFPTDSEDEIRNVRVTSVRLCPHAGSPSSVLIRNKDDLWRALEDFNIHLHQAIFYTVGIQFEFEGKGQSRFRTVELTSKNKANLNNGLKDEIITRYLMRWGIMNV